MNVATIIKAVTDLPARLFGGNAQTVEVSGLDYTLHLDLEKLPENEGSIEAEGNWTVVWDETNDLYKRVEFTDLPVPPAPPPSTVITGNGIVVETRAQIAGTWIDPAVQFISTQGFAEPGDAGHGNYDRYPDHPYPLWEAGINYNAWRWVRNAAGQLYICSWDPGYDTMGTGTLDDDVPYLSATEPTHTEPWLQVIGADNYGWTAVPLNPAYAQSLDGAWWRLIPQGGQVFFEQFGCKADYVSSSDLGTDNWPALQHAKGFIAFATPPVGNARWTYQIMVSPGAYYFSKQLSFYEVVHIKGVASGYLSTGSAQHVRWYFPNTITWMVFHQNNTGPGEDEALIPRGGSPGNSTGSIIDGICLVRIGDDSYEDLNLSGILMRTMVHLRHVQVFLPAGKAFHIRAYAGWGGKLEGNANQWQMEYCLVHSGKSDGLCVDGADVNAGVCINFATLSDTRGCGIKNMSWYANTYIGSQISGSGNVGYHYEGKYYALLSNTPGAGEATVPGTPGTENTWRHFSTGSTLNSTRVQWVPDPPTPYRIKSPVYDSGAGVHLGLYVESNSGIPSHFSVGSMCIGGNSICTVDSMRMSAAGGNFTCRTGFSVSRTFPAGSPEAIKHGTDISTTYGGPSGGGLDQGINIFKYTRNLDGAVYEFGHDDNEDLILHTGNTNFLRITLNSTLTKFGTQAPLPGRLGLYDPVLIDRTNSNNARVLGYRSASPTSIGEHVRGDRYLNVSATGPAGVQGWVCTQSGVNGSGAWVSGSTYGGGEIRQSSTGFYRNKTFGVSTIEPTHLTGTVTYDEPGTDMTWTYLGTTTPIYEAVYDYAPALLDEMQTTIQALTERIEALEGT